MTHSSSSDKCPSRSRKPSPCLITVLACAALLAPFSALAQSLVAAVLPSSRSVEVGVTATAFATLINAGTASATGCRISPPGAMDIDFAFQTTDPLTNALTGTLNNSADIAPGRSQSFAVFLTPRGPIPPTDVALTFDCDNTEPAPTVPGVNTLLLSATVTPVADMVALSATQTGDGIVSLPTLNGMAAFAVATINLGTGTTIVASADSGGVDLPITLSICQTDPTTAACLAAPASSVTIPVSSEATPTFSIFLAGNGNVMFDPAVNRIFVRFRDTTEAIRGATSVAVRTAPQNAVAEAPIEGNLGYKVFGANDLGMHCADLDYQIFSILPPFNVIHTQVLRLGDATTLPRVLDDSDVSVVYSAATNPAEPALVDPPSSVIAATQRASVSINSTSHNDSAAGVYKSNFWHINPATGHTFGFDAYHVLYPAGALAGFDPIPTDRGLPVPDLARLPALVTGQQDMPGISFPFVVNSPQPFDRFDRDVPFFVDFPFGEDVLGVNWFAADGLPIMPVDDAGRRNAYPLMRIQAQRNGSVVGTTDMVVPVASEADCQSCHADQSVCDHDPTLGSVCTGVAASFASIDFDVFTDVALAPGATATEQVLNAAKINILRLHDAKHGAAYTTAGGETASCNPASDAQSRNCLANQVPLQCAQCHYSPALDLAQVGPVDEPEAGPRGRQQTRHATMSRVMHHHHGQFTDLFPAMPPPGTALSGRLDVLGQTCYQCHPGKRTQCLRGAMFAGGMLCQDCHGDMLAVGNDFSENFLSTPFPLGADLSKRVPWASEPACESCHTGDAVNNLAGAPGTVVAADGIRLVQAYLTGDADAVPIESDGSRYGQNQRLYRLSKGHGGVLCEGCHGSPHAIWPNPNPNANDNVTAVQLQGHRGTILECTACHASGSLPGTLGGPHGMHPVNDPAWIKGGSADHKDFAEAENAKPGGGACGACHGSDHRGTVLSRTPVDRVLRDANGNPSASVAAGQIIGCDLCHSLEESFETENEGEGTENEGEDTEDN